MKCSRFGRVFKLLLASSLSRSLAFISKLLRERKPLVVGLVELWNSQLRDCLLLFCNLPPPPSPSTARCRVPGYPEKVNKRIRDCYRGGAIISCFKYCLYLINLNVNDIEQKRDNIIQFEWNFSIFYYIIYCMLVFVFIIFLSTRFITSIKVCKLYTYVPRLVMFNFAQPCL